MTLLSRLTLIGVGMIGGSIGLAARKRRLADRIVGIDTYDRNLETAIRLGILDHGTTDLKEGMNLTGIAGPFSDAKPRSELIVIATPVGTVPESLRQILDIANRPENAGRRILVTDVGSTKNAIRSEWEQMTSKNRSAACRYVGSHPIAGSSSSGPEHADAGLFENRTAVVTPMNSDRDVDVGLLALFWQSLGSTVLCLAPDIHDRILARTSHLPHLLSSLMAESLHANEAPFTGPGFHSTTRLASGMPSLWRDVVSSNSDAILEAISGFENELGQLKQAIEKKQWDEITAFLQLAKRNRDALDKKRMDSCKTGTQK